MFGKKSFKFTDKRNPITAFFSTIIAVISIVTMILICFQSSESAGQGGLWIGIVGMLALIGSIVGFVLAILSLRKKEVYYTLAIIGAVSNGLLLLIFFIVYVIGASI